MLRLLKITNFAIIDDLEIAFGSGLNVLTGETGAGKSIIFDALNLTLGARAGGDLVRGGAKEAIVESLFEIPDTAGGNAARSLLEEAGVEMEDGGELIVRRRVAEAGRSRIYLNGVLGTASAALPSGRATREHPRPARAPKPPAPRLPPGPSGRLCGH